jgi:carbonic anhydrase/acetyltransferase-like protein (isoleucine patch superfamily)
MALSYFVDEILETGKRPMRLPDTNIIIGSDTVVRPPTYLENDVFIKKEGHVVASHLRDVKLGEDNLILYSHLLNVEAGDGVKIDNSTVRYSHINSGSIVTPYNFISDVIINKQVLIDVGCYLEKATIGNCSVLGPGVKIIQHNDFMEHATKIGDKVFIGANVIIMAPCEIEDEVFIEPGVVLKGIKSPLPKYSYIEGHGTDYRIHENRIFYFPPSYWIRTEKNVNVNFAQEIQKKYQQFLKIILKFNKDIDCVLSKEEKNKLVLLFKMLDEDRKARIEEILEEKIKSLA